MNSGVWAEFVDEVQTASPFRAALNSVWDRRCQKATKDGRPDPCRKPVLHRGDIGCMMGGVPAIQGMGMTRQLGVIARVTVIAKEKVIYGSDRVDKS